MKYSHRYPITSADMDSHYRVTVTALLNYFQDTSSRYLTSLGRAAFDMQKENKTWVITETNIEMPEALAIWTEEIDMTVWISEQSPLRLWFEFIATEHRSGRTVACGNSCWSMISFSERRPVSLQGLIADELLEAEYASGPHRRKAPQKPAEEPVSTTRHTINTFDLDMNGHTNNCHYVTMAITSVPPEYQEGHRPDSLNIRFLRESLLGDDLTICTYTADAPDSGLSLISNASGEEICRIASHWRPNEPFQDLHVSNPVRNQ